MAKISENNYSWANKDIPEKELKAGI